MTLEVGKEQLAGLVANMDAIQNALGAPKQHALRLFSGPASPNGPVTERDVSTPAVPFPRSVKNKNAGRVSRFEC